MLVVAVAVPAATTVCGGDAGAAGLIKPGVSVTENHRNYDTINPFEICDFERGAGDGAFSWKRRADSKKKGSGEARKNLQSVFSKTRFRRTILVFLRL